MLSIDLLELTKMIRCRLFSFIKNQSKEVYLKFVNEDVNVSLAFLVNAHNLIANRQDHHEKAKANRSQKGLHKRKRK